MDRSTNLQQESSQTAYGASICKRSDMEQGVMKASAKDVYTVLNPYLKRYTSAKSPILRRLMQSAGSL